MSSHKQRTIVVSLLAAAIGVRIAASESLWDSAAQLSARPREALATALDGWSAEGTLGVASAQGLRDLPLALSYAAADLIDLPPVAVQATWRALLLVLAVLGAIRLARGVAARTRAAAGTAESWAPWVAATFFGCSALMVATAARHPLDGLAAATLPWVVHPLVNGPVGWRSAAASASWVGVAGFGSIAWAMAALVAGVLAAVSRARSELTQLYRWLVLAALASAWWVVLAVWEALHGTNISALLPDRTPASHLASAVGWMYLSTPLVFLVAVAPLVVALAALLFRAPGTDRALVGGLVVVALLAIALITTEAWVPPTFARAGLPMRGLILGPPLSLLALASLLAWTPLARRLSEALQSGTWAWTYLRPRGVLLLLVTGVIVLPNVANLIAATQERREIPPPGSQALWADIASWSLTAPPGRALVLPALDGHHGNRLVSQALGDRAWIGRDSLPGSGTPGTRALDDLLSRLSRGESGPAVEWALRRLAISYVIIRDDLPTDAAQADRNAMARAALRDAGARPVRHHVAGAGGEAGERSLVNFGIRPSSPQVQIWALNNAATASLYPGSPLRVIGESGAVGDLDDAGITRGRPVRLVTGADATAPAIVSDSARRRDIDLRVAVDPVGPTLPEDDLPVVVPSDAAPWQTSWRSVSGADRVSASSTAADVRGTHRSPASHAMAALDGNAFTAWESRRGTGFGEWWQIDFDRPTDLAGSTVTFKQDIFGGHDVTRVRVDTDPDSIELDVVPGEPLSLDLAAPAERLRFTVTRVSTWTRNTDSVGITEIEIPGLSIRDELLVSGSAGPADWLLTALPGSFRTCVPPAGPTGGTRPVVVCDRGLTVPGFEGGPINRVLQNDTPREVTGHVWARAAQTESAGSLADTLAEGTVTASASSVAAPDLATRPQSAVDADASTAWRPAADDPAPSLSLSWAEPAEVTGIHLETGDQQLSSTPTLVRVSGDDGEEITAVVSTAGAIDFAPLKTRTLRVEFLEDSGLTTTDSFTGSSRQLPIAIHEVTLLGGPDVTYDKDGAQALPCGSGPALSVASQALQTRLTLSARDILDGAVVHAQACSPIRFSVADVRVQVPASFSWTPLGVLLADTDTSRAPLGSTDRQVGTGRIPLPVSAELLTDPSEPESVPLQDATPKGASTLVLAVPAQAGWSARTAGASLSPVTIDGWAQGWSVPAGTEVVELDYSPARSLRVGAVAGGISWLLVVIVWLSGRVPTRTRPSAPSSTDAS